MLIFFSDSFLATDFWGKEAFMPNGPKRKKKKKSPDERNVAREKCIYCLLLHIAIALHSLPQNNILC